ncbi:MAG: N-6 DNA methylase [Chloroflexota bacterium]
MKTDSSLYLQEVYEKLEFRTGAGFYSLTDLGSQPDLSRIGWIEQARKLEAEAVYFVGDYPVALFFKLDDFLEADTQEYEKKIYDLYLEVWNTSRVPMFFVALPFEVRVYSAYQKPVHLDEWQSEERWLGKVKTITQVLPDWQAFSRPEVESGQLFREFHKSFRAEERVDQWLLRNLRQLRQRLGGNDSQKREHVHALIGRSIFIRYLEDRGALVEDYFDINPAQKYCRYVEVLGNKDDTYRLFRKLREDFNGDLFPLSEAEQDSISQADLSLLGAFLDGRSMGDQPDLLFWAYQFDIIPIELISSIYEEFYHENGGEDNRGTHYTPTTLVDFVLSQCLTPERLDRGARVLDPACGSGIFLVEAFKRMVYRECQRKGIIDVTQLPGEELARLLTKRIVGIDINQPAIQVAAFSLYLAFLDFRKPPDIRQNKQLPKLVYDPQQPAGGKSLFCANTFYPTRSEQATLAGEHTLPLENAQFDVIIGNPPWGQATGQEGQLAVDWCKAFGYPVGDKEWSQGFIWRAQHLLKPGGEIGLLVSTGVFFKHGENSKAFRQKWLRANQVRAVYNFAHVRRVFFRKQEKNAISPFAAIFFAPASPEKIGQNRVAYIAVKQSTFVEQLQAVVIDKTDLHKIRQSELLAKDWLWKTYMWGGLSDADLIEELKGTGQVLGDVVTDYSRGFIDGSYPRNKSTKELGVNFELDVDVFQHKTDLAKLVVPIKHRTLYRLGKPAVYQGPRLIIKRGISRSGNKSGEIQARLAYEPFAFPSSLIGFRLDGLSVEKQQVLLGVVLSSLAKYYHFLTCSTWGFWRYEIHEEEYLSLPVRFPDSPGLHQRILNAVQQITTQSGTPNLFDLDTPGWQAMQAELDDAIFDLYELSEPQRDLVCDLCQTTLEFFYEGADSQAASPPTVEWLEAYREAFLETWIERLSPKGKELETRIYAPHHGLLCGMAFELKEKDTALRHPPVTDDAEWQRWFRQLSTSLRKELTEGIYVDRVVKELSDSGMLIVKRAERRFWTKSQARQDAQELLTEVFKLEWQQQGE